MICIIGLIVFGILGIFSLSYRKLAKEALDCVSRKVVFKPCKSNLDERIKSSVTGKLMNKNQFLAKFVFKNFEILSWIFVIITIASLVSVSITGYNYYVYGNCNGEQDDGFCIFDPTGAHSKISEIQSCSIIDMETEIGLNGFDSDLFYKFNEGAENKVIIIGCYECEYTRKVYPDLKKLIGRDDVEAIFAHLPVNHEEGICNLVYNCLAKEHSSKLIEFNDAMFSLDTINDESVLGVVSSIGLDIEEMESCIESEEIKELSAKQMDELTKTNVYGTPTVFINGESVVGPKQLRVYKRMLK